MELYDLGRTTHRVVRGMYKFIINNIDKYLSNKDLTEKLKEEARSREVQGHSIPQEYFSTMCDVWTKAYRTGDFPIDLEATVFPDTILRFQKVKANGRKIGILTSASRDFTELLYNVPISPERKLSDLVDEYFLGEEIGDKDLPETHAGLWERTKGGIYAIFDDKLSVCEAAREGLDLAGGNSKIYLVDRKEQYIGGVLEKLAEKGIIKVRNFDEVQD